jgi:copper chaperone CopZ
MSAASELTYRVDGIHCNHCGLSITEEVEKVPGVSRVDVDVEARTVVVLGESVDDAAVRAAIEEAGYEAA